MILLAIDNLQVSYPDFVLGSIIDPEQIDQNNVDVTNKVNEIIDVVEANEIDIEGKVTALTDVVAGHEADIEGKVAVLTGVVNANEIDIEAKVTALTGTVNTNEADIESKYTALGLAIDANEADIEGKVTTLTGTVNTNNTNRITDLNTHKTSSDHDTRYYTKTEILSGGSLNVGHETFIATEGQTVFNLTHGAYPVGARALNVIVGGLHQSYDAFTENSTTQFTLDEGLPVGTEVFTYWFNNNNMPITSHASTHAVGGTDQLDLANFPVVDAGGYYASNNIEGVLQEVGSNLDAVEANIATIESDITAVEGSIAVLDAELNTPDVSTHTQILSSIQFLPVGTVDGVVGDVEIEGLSLVNSVVNGDFSDGTTGWTPVASTHTVLSNKLSNTGNGASDIAREVNGNSVNHALNDVFFAYAKARVTNINCANLYIRLRDASAYIVDLISNPVQNQWYELYGKLITPDTNVVQANLYHSYADAATANGKVMEVDGNAGIFAINMTALGIEDFTEAQMLDLVRSGYIDGLQSLYRPVVKSVGKNLSPVNSYNGNVEYVNETLNSVGDVIVSNIKINPVKSYILSGVDPTGRMKVFFHNTPTNATYQSTVYTSIVGGGDGVELSRNQATSGYKYATITAGPSFPETVASVGSIVEYTNIQLEEGTTTTPYEPYRSSQLTLDIPLRSLPNGVADRVYEADGQVWLEKNVEEYVLFSADVKSMLTTYTNIDYARINKMPDYIFANTGGEQNNKYLFGRYERVFPVGWDDISLIGKVGASGYANEFWVGFAKGTSLATAQTALAGTKIHYQLATPQLINLTEEGLASGELMSFEGGTVYNSSDTFHSPLVTFDVPTNRSAQIDSLLESANAQAKQIEAKANKVQEDWIEPTLLNGWVNYGGGGELCAFMKDDFGFVHIRGLIKTGTLNTTVFVLPQNYRPIGVMDSPIACGSVYGRVNIGTDGLVKIIEGSNTRASLGNISFRVGE